MQKSRREKIEDWANKNPKMFMLLFAIVMIALVGIFSALDKI